jgi:Pyruvate/2-oxoacid:ferredoxin oxidoreductase delta subunit
MKALDSNINKEKKKEKHRKSHRRKKKEIISETHLTASGVCTTICPENSGM